MLLVYTVIYFHCLRNYILKKLNIKDNVLNVFIINCWFCLNLFRKCFLMFADLKNFFNVDRKGWPLVSMSRVGKGLKST